MRITIEDLEALKELNDELEENHIETEKSLMEELGKTVKLFFSTADKQSHFRNQGCTDTGTRKEGRAP